VRGFVARGEAQLGVVYRSDATGFDGFRWCWSRRPEQPNIVYPAAMTVGAADSSKSFLRWLRTPEASAVFRRTVSSPCLEAGPCSRRCCAPFEAEALWLSLRVAAASLVGVIPVSLDWLCCWRGDGFPGKWLLEALVNLPLVLPPVVTGLALLIVFGVRGPVGGWLYEVFGVTLAFHWTGAALAAGIMALPLVVRPLRLSLEAVDPRLEQAAATLGAPPLHIFRAHHPAAGRCPG
jgi:ABC-type sulfate transport system permease subunit